MNKLYTLTPREREVLELVCQGFRNAEIGDMLYIAEQTVKNHVNYILRKLELRNRAEVACRYGKEIVFNL